MEKLKKAFNSRGGFLILASLFFWIKTYIAYVTEFNLGVSGPLQHFILLLNPLPIIVLLLSLGLFFKNKKASYGTMILIYILLSILLYANILYYREFSDFLTVNIMLGASGVSTGLTGAAFELARFKDIVYWADLIILLGMLFTRKTKLQPAKKPSRKRVAAGFTFAGLGLLALNISLAEISRPQLLERTFDRNYIVKYLGLNFFTGYDAHQTIENSQVRASADGSDLSEVVSFVEDHQTEPNPEYFGVAEGKNVVAVALESTQQFIIDYQLEGQDGTKYEVTPFLNDLYHSDSTLSFSNFYHQTGQGKSSDAEILAENSLFGLPQGSAFQTLGTSNTFYSTPNILAEEAGYTSAAFHGNVGSFWNRTETYQSFGYDYFFDANSYNLTDENTVEYGLTDKVFFHDSAEYLQQLPEPFYSKFITVTNHFPYPLDDVNASIPDAQTSDDTINQYFATNRYQDESIEEFMNWMKETGLYEDTIFVFYGDHYGVSNMRNPVLGELLGVDSEEWGDYHNTMMQQVPFMIHVPGFEGGQIFDQVGGQVDVLPTLLHLLGIETDPYLFMGQDLLSPSYKEGTILRNGRVVTPEYSFIGSDIYDTETGENVTETVTDDELQRSLDTRKRLTQQMSNSDKVMQLDLLRFYTPEPLKGIEPNEYIYQDQMPYLKNHPNADQSLINQSELENPASIYKTDAPELQTENAQANTIQDLSEKPEGTLLPRTRSEIPTPPEESSTE